jgi:hypothetical protein
VIRPFHVFSLRPKAIFASIREPSKPGNRRITRHRWLSTVFTTCTEKYNSAFDKRETFVMEYRLRYHSGQQSKGAECSYIPCGFSNFLDADLLLFHTQGAEKKLQF